MVDWFRSDAFFHRLVSVIVVFVDSVDFVALLILFDFFLIVFFCTFFNLLVTFLLVFMLSILFILMIFSDVDFVVMRVLDLVCFLE